MQNQQAETRQSRPAKRRWSVVTVATFAAFLAGFGAASLPGSQAIADSAEAVVYKTPYCGCCKKWVAQLEAAGIAVRTVDVNSTAPVQADVGVPGELRSCHTAKIGNYWVEGHVPPDLVVELLKDQPTDIAGLTVPGMPIGSPGMEGPNPQRYEVLRVTTEGKVEVHAVREGKAVAP